MRFSYVPRTDLYILQERLSTNVSNQSFFIYQLMRKRTALKRILQFTLKQLLHLDIWLAVHHSITFLL